MIGNLEGVIGYSEGVIGYLEGYCNGSITPFFLKVSGANGS